MKKLCLIIMVLMLLLSGCKTSEATQFEDFVVKLAEINTIVEKRGYQPATVVAQYSRFDYVFPSGSEAIAVEYVNDLYDSFTIAFYANFTRLDEFPEAIDKNFIADIVKALSGKKFDTAELTEFLGSDEYLTSSVNSSVFQCVKEKGNIEVDDYIFYFEVLNSGFGYFEVSGLLDTAIKDAYSYNSEIQKIFMKYKYNGFTISHTEVVLAKLNDSSELSIVLPSNFENDIVDIYFSNNFSIVYRNELRSAKERIKNIDIDLFIEIIELLSRKEMAMKLLHDFLFDSKGEYETPELEAGFLSQKFYMAETGAFMLNYELQSNFIELLTYHFFEE